MHVYDVHEIIYLKKTLPCEIHSPMQNNMMYLAYNPLLLHYKSEKYK